MYWSTHLFQRARKQYGKIDENCLAYHILVPQCSDEKYLALELLNIILCYVCFSAHWEHSLAGTFDHSKKPENLSSFDAVYPWRAHCFYNLLPQASNVKYNTADINLK